MQPTNDDPSTDLDEQDVPPELAETMRTAFGLDAPPATLGDWVTAASRLLDDSTLSVTVEEMCTAGESRHVARIDGEGQHFHCVLDALLVPFVLPGESPVDVRSRSPVSDAVVELAVSRDAVEATPADAVMSFGLADGIEIPDPAAIDPELAYAQACPYINAFPDRAEYERWADDTSEASTMALPFPAGLELARTLAGPPGDGAG